MGSPPLLYGEATCHQSGNRAGLDTAADAKRSHRSSADEVSYAKSAGSPSATGNAPYWPEGSPMNRGTSRDREENKEGSPRNKGMNKDREENTNERSRRPRDSKNFSNSSDQ